MIKYAKDVLKERKDNPAPIQVPIGNDEFEKYLHKQTFRKNKTKKQ